MSNNNFHQGQNPVILNWDNEKPQSSKEPKKVYLVHLGSLFLDICYISASKTDIQKKDPRRTR